MLIKNKVSKLLPSLISANGLVVPKNFSKISYALPPYLYPPFIAPFLSTIPARKVS